MDDKSVAHFIKYNNTVPIILGIVFLSASATFAATPAARDAVYKSSSQIQSVDNSYIVNADLETYPFAIRITSVTEDGEKYYISYDFDTIDVVEYVWQDVTRQGTLTVYKALLRGGDLRVYAETEFAQLQASELVRLKKTQELEKKIGVNQKTIATAYSGLIGKFIEPTEETLPFYQPPPELQNKNNPLALKNPKPLVTWDANEKPEIEEPEQQDENTNENNNGGGGEETPPPEEDLCPLVEGIQTDTTLCPVEEPPTEEPTPSPEEETPPSEESEPIEETLEPETAEEPEPEPEPESPPTE